MVRRLVQCADHQLTCVYYTVRIYNTDGFQTRILKAGVQSLVQSTQPSGPYFSESQSFAFLKWPLPKNPRFALSGEGCWRLGRVVASTFSQC